MQYYKYELWEKLNTGNEIERQEAEEQWNKNATAYDETFKAIKDRLPQKFLKSYVNNHGFHDFLLEKIEIINTPYGYEHSSKKNPIHVNIMVSNRRSRWMISYKGVKKVSISQEGEIWYDQKQAFESWGYSEFIELNDKTLSHEILFASGATLLIHFARISIERVHAD